MYEIFLMFWKRSLKIEKNKTDGNKIFVQNYVLLTSQSV